MEQAAIPEHPATQNRAPSFLYGIVILLSAFLLFQVQPLIAKLILPWFGGSAAVWTACMLFFQVVLLAGYAWAHWLNGQPAKRAFVIHVGLLVVSLAALPILPSVRWRPAGDANPLLGILGLLAVTVGLPYFALASTSPLLQTWYSRSRNGAMPWRFFALSNAGSMAGLLVYPFLVEPALSGHDQAWGWSAGYGLFALLCAGLALASARTHSVPQSGNTGGPAPAVSERLLWIGLAAGPSALLLAVTNHVSQNVAALPLLWVLPLSLYLLSFILCFDSNRWYRRQTFAVLGAAALVSLIYLISVDINLLRLENSVPLFNGAAFVLFIVAHGELARRRPSPAYLTSFYLMISLGGMIGGLLIAVAAPGFLNAVYDLPFVLGLFCCLFAILIRKERAGSAVDDTSAFLRTPKDWLVVLALTTVGFFYLLARLVSASSLYDEVLFAPKNDSLLVGLGAGILLYLVWRGGHSRRTSYAIASLTAVLVVSACAVLAREGAKTTRDARVMVRNFYGALGVIDLPPSGSLGPVRALMHGTIEHGRQLQKHRQLPTTYYSQRSGIGRTLKTLMNQGPLKVGLIGLGAGTLAAYARPEDRYRFYEINPLVLRIARTEFSFLRDCKAPYDVVLGDARLSLENEPSQQFDVLVVDAFSGDAIPVHLLTREAFRLYWRHLKPDGVLAVHVTNSYLALAPVVAMGALEMNKEAHAMFNLLNTAREEATSEWVMVSMRTGFFESEEIAKVAYSVPIIGGLQMWTDDFSNLYRILKKQ